VYPFFHVSGITQIENGTNAKPQLLCLLQTKRKWQTSVCLLQTEVCFPWLANDKQLLSSAVSKRAHLCLFHDTI
jgi:hypothetical protein